MKRQCRASGCTALTTLYGIYCSTHKDRNRRHGAPDQRGITKFDLKPYLTQIQARIEKNQGLTIWTLLDQRWAGLTSYAEGFELGTRSRWTHDAAKEVRKLALMVDPRLAVTIVLAMYLMREQAGHRFRSDRAFNTQLVRRLRALTEANVLFSTSTRTGRQARVYTEVPPRVTAIMAEWIIGALGTAGVWFARSEKASEDRRREGQEAYRQGLMEIDFR